MSFKIDCSRWYVQQLCQSCSISSPEQDQIQGSVLQELKRLLQESACVEIKEFLVSYQTCHAQLSWKALDVFRRVFLDVNKKFFLTKCMFDIETYFEIEARNALMSLRNALAKEHKRRQLGSYIAVFEELCKDPKQISSWLAQPQNQASLVYLLKIELSGSEVEEEVIAFWLQQQTNQDLLAQAINTQVEGFHNPDIFTWLSTEEGRKIWQEWTGGQLEKIVTLSDDNSIRKWLRKNKAALSTVWCIDLQKAAMIVIPEEIKYLKGLKFLDLSHNNIGIVPSGIFENMKNLQKLDLSHNHIIVDGVPEGVFDNVTELNLSHNYCYKNIPEFDEARFLGSGANEMVRNFASMNSYAMPMTPGVMPMMPGVMPMMPGVMPMMPGVMPMMPGFHPKFPGKAATWSAPTSLQQSARENSERITKKMLTTIAEVLRWLPILESLAQGSKG